MIPVLVASAAWLWAGVPVEAVPPATTTLYVYQGVIAGGAGRVVVHHRGIYPHPGTPREVVPVVRLSGSPSAEDCARLLEGAARAWEARGRRVPRVQIDHDAPSRKLAAYAEFVAGVRRRLDRRYGLSVTALADWLVAAPPDDLERLARAADEIVFQLYHGAHAIPRLEHYDAALARLAFPFKAGLLPGMAPPPRAARSPGWRGSIVFLEKPEPGDPVDASRR